MWWLDKSNTLSALPSLTSQQQQKNKTRCYSLIFYYVYTDICIDKKPKQNITGRESLETYHYY